MLSKERNDLQSIKTALNTALKEEEVYIDSAIFIKALLEYSKH